MTAASAIVFGATSKPTLTLFSPGALPAPNPADAAPAFTPDGTTLFIGRLINDQGVIVVSTKHNGHWTDAHPASFSGQQRDLEPAMDPKGKYLVFASSRPINKGGKPLDGRWGGVDQPGKGGNLWRFDLGNPQAAPSRLPDQINANTATFSPALTADGTLWFMRAVGGAGFHIFRAAMRAGQYLEPTPAPFTAQHFSDFDPAVSPDESFVIFSSSPLRNGKKTKNTALFITFKQSKAWTAPLDLADGISPAVHGIEARLSPDAKMLYFTNGDSPSGEVIETNRYIWSVRLDLNKLRRLSMALPHLQNG
jgi:Tol biopolymer transport system component